MRLLQLKDDGSLSLVERVGNTLAETRYAILSHTWGADKDEVTFADILGGTGQSKAGYRKILFCGRQAAKDNLQYFWVDTCCIDKTSSAELAEAINSMFRWYQNAARCYVYLPDVSIGGLGEDDFSKRWKPAFRRSRWFTRGWTLQELIAPSSVEFFSKEEQRLGDKRSLEQTIHEITKITIQVLHGAPISSFSAEERMSWAAKRETKREEDAAYCLLGIFNVHMPLIYGEGKRNAMKRLQKEIDESLMLVEVEQRPAMSQDTPQMSISEELGVPDLQFELDQLDYDRCPNTGAWLREDQAFISFTKCAVSAAFHLCGNPGSGKTFLLSKAVDELRQYALTAGGTSVAFFLCDGKSEAYNRRTSLAVLKSLTAQLLEKIMEVDAGFARRNVEALVLVKRKAKEAPEGQLFNILTKCLRYFKECYIVIDAVDECDDWENMLRIFTRLIDTNVCQLKFLLSSQKGAGIPYIISRLPVATKYRVDVAGPAVESDIARYVDWRVRTLDLRNLGSPGEARESLIHGSDGLFLLAKLRLDILSKQILPISTNIRAAISELPSDIFPLYERLLARLDDAQKSLAQVLFIWITHAQRVLTVEELMEAYRIELLSSGLPGATLSELEIEYLGGGLIEVHEGRVRLAHSTVRDFVSLYDWGSRARVSEMSHGVLNQRLFMNCLDYITNEKFVSGITSTAQFSSDIQKTWPLAEYTVRHWIGHLGQFSAGTSELVTKVISFIRSEAGLAWWVCYTHQIKIHDWWTLPEISADINEWLYRNHEMYRPDANAMDFVLDLCQRHVSALEHHKFTNKLDLYIPALLRLAEQKLDYGYCEEAESLVKLAVRQSERIGTANGETMAFQAKLDLTKLLRYEGRYDEAMELCESLKAGFEKAGDKSSRQRINTDQTFGLTAGESGQYELSETHFRELVETAVSSLGANDPDSLAVVHGLAWTCYNRGNFKEAETLWDIETFQTVLGKSHPSTLTIMECVAHLKRAQGDYDGSRQMLSDTLRLRQVRLGAQSVDTIRGEIGLAYCSRTEEEIASATETIRRLLQMTIDRFSYNHFLVLELKGALAELFRIARDLITAEKLQLELVQKRRELQGERHISTVNEKTRVGIIRLDRGDYEEAATMLTEVRDIRLAEYATDYRGLCGVLGFLARAKRSIGRLHEAEKLALKSLEYARKCKDDENPDLLVAMTDVAIIKRRQGQFTEAEDLHQQVMRLRLKRLSGDHPDVLSAMGNLAITKGQQGHHDEALELEQKILDVRRKAMGQSHPDVILAMANLAVTKRKQGQFKEAEDLEEQVLELRRKTMGEDHSYLLNAMGNLAITKGRLGQDKEAERLEEQVLSLRLKIMPKTHPDVLTAMGNLAITKRKCKKLREAIKLQEGVIELRKQVMDEDNPEVLNSISSLAISKVEAGQYKEAIELEEQVLEARSRTLPEDHPDVLSTMSNMAIAKRRLGYYEDARNMEREILELHRQTMSEDSAEVINATANLAITISEMEQYEEAEHLEEEVLKLRLRTEPEDSPDVLISMANLAITKRKQSKYLEAIRLEERVLELRRKTLESTHPDVYSAMGNLAITKRRHGHYKEAMELEEEVYDLRKRTLDEDNPELITAMANLAITRRECGNLEGAQQLDERVFELRRQNLEEDNPNVLDAMSNLASTVLARKDFAYAKRLYEDLIAKTEAAFGSDHQRTVRAKLGLGNALDEAGERNAAEQVFKEVVIVSRNSLGEESPDTLNCHFFLGEFLLLQGRYDEAEEHCEKVLSGRLKLFGEDNEETLTSMVSWSSLLFGQRDWLGAEMMSRNALDGRTKVLGPSHAQTLTSANLLGLVLMRGRHYAEAEGLHRQALAGRTELFGMQDKETMDTVGDLAYVLRALGKFSEEEELLSRYNHPGTLSY